MKLNALITAGALAASLAAFDQASAQSIARITVEATITQPANDFADASYNQIQDGDSFLLEYAVDLTTANQGSYGVASQQVVQLSVGGLNQTAGGSLSALQGVPGYTSGTFGNLGGTPVWAVAGTTTLAGGVQVGFEGATFGSPLITTEDLFANGSFTGIPLANFPQVVRIVGPSTMAGALTSTTGILSRIVVDVPIGTNYCVAAQNAAGTAGTIAGSGSRIAALNDVTFTMAGLFPLESAIMLTSKTAGFAPVAQGNLCLGGTIGRYNQPGQVFQADAAGSATFSPNLVQTPQGAAFVSIVAGETWHFQCWYRDRDTNGNPSANFTNGLLVNFL